MKKLVITFLVTLLLIIPLASAGILSDFFDWIGITGKTTENETNETETTCSDSDGGLDYYTKGTVTSSEGSITDACIDSYELVEWVCDEMDSIEDEYYVCPYGCENGACLEEPSPEPEPEICAASIKISFTQDVYYVGDYGKLTVEIFDSAGNLIPNYPFYASTYYYSSDEWEDSPSLTTNEEGNFESSGEIHESDVKGKMLYKVYTQETSSCSKVESTTEVEFRSKENGETPPGPEPGPRPEVCATRISINFDKNVYYIGEEFKVEIGIFDSQGNPIPNYLFYLKVYDYDKGMWHPSFEEDRTDGSGYRIHQYKISMGEPFRFGKNKLKIYTDVGGCNLVEDIAIIEIKRKEGPEPVPCGIGTCVPEEEVEEVEAISEDKIFYKCNGCELDNKCYPIGYRKEGKYCGIDYEFINQIDGSCDNNFECKSNVCLAGDCLTTGFIQKIIDWLKAFFGMKPKPPEEAKCSKLLIEKNIGDYKYVESGYGEDEHTQAPLFSEDGKHIGTIKCCGVEYIHKENDEGKKENRKAAIVCPYNSREEMRNSLIWIMAKEGDIGFAEYKGEKVLGDVDEVIVWTHKSYIVATGGDPRSGTPIADEIAKAYLKRYPSDLDIKDDEIPEVEEPTPTPKPLVYCTSEDEEATQECVESGGKPQTDGHPDEKCEVYAGCLE